MSEPTNDGLKSHFKWHSPSVLKARTQQCRDCTKPLPLKMVGQGRKPQISTEAIGRTKFMDTEEAASMTVVKMKTS